MHDVQNTCLNAYILSATNAHAPMHVRLCNGVETTLPWNIAILSWVLREHRAGCCLPPALLLSWWNQSPDADRSRNPSKSTLAHDTVAAAVWHEHLSIIRVGAGLIHLVFLKPPLIDEACTMICTRPNFRAAPLFPNLDCNLCPNLTAHWEPIHFSELNHPHLNKSFGIKFQGPKIVMAPTRQPSLKSAVTHVQIVIYHSTLVQSNVSLLLSFRDQTVFETSLKYLIKEPS